MGQELKPKIKVKHRPTGLIILDGWGHREETEFNAIAQANTPNFDKLMAENPNTLISTSGMDVGLPHGQMGNSEVGHMNLGAGRVVYQELTRIQKDIDDGRFFSNNALNNAIDKAVERDHVVHIMGLLSDGGVHSHINHIKAALKLAADRGAKTVLHIFSDGRDTAPQSALKYIDDIENTINELKGDLSIGSITGRFYALDRDNRWERTEEAYSVICCGKAEFKADSAREAVEAAYERGETDEFIQPTVILNKKGKKSKIKDGDSVIFMNFRSDRARQLTRAFILSDFAEFHRCNTPLLAAFVTLTEYHKNFENFGATIAYRPSNLKNTFGEVISKLKLRQLRIAETEKYAHVTFFLNGGVEAPYLGEDRILIPSPKVRTYDLQPEMSVGELTEKLVEAIESDKYDTFICNIANPDMVGHTGNMEACIKAVEAVDEALGKILNAIEKAGGQCIVTADHGNMEMLQDPETGEPFTSHTTFPVPLVYFGPKKDVKLRSGARLPDVMPTMLDIMEIPQPEEMDGVSIIAK
ncbi:2,3-bisphosphoglycerate-independent phosphoglycerate mutase [Thiomicrorhabdus xiamenensis]|uniref:2,3-bisphosphoglycerate-independent phosphoglycerate mutase n=1 Tax=Thiomicrorhabdus xiamenensis TaxID=2739063 RepID=A0A7D4NX53_9GAMM|nr:2,3-bisphosphoglycerate-independent phosphoglycerate mutase [Thiomicrorhabdus xiamenensis]QKI88338.1 2,3-bisphosphoglycerate-independent phosphoglycerate mutase [Thiomicrorhabdus xiamenensis]